jgi:GNAT superfamily N-acetyltransferase
VQRALLQVGGDAMAAPVPAYGGECVLGAVGLVGVAVQARAPDHLALTDGQEHGVAAHLKRRTLHWAAANGIRELYTWTQAGNTSMLRLNEHLGYEIDHTGITVSRPLPL